MCFAVWVGHRVRQVIDVQQVCFEGTQQLTFVFVQGVLIIRIFTNTYLQNQQLFLKLIKLNCYVSFLKTLKITTHMMVDPLLSSF